MSSYFSTRAPPNHFPETAKRDHLLVISAAVSGALAEGGLRGSTRAVGREHVGALAGQGGLGRAQGGRLRLNGVPVQPFQPRRVSPLPLQLLRARYSRRQLFLRTTFAPVEIG